jgi:hypothetical protein
MFITADRGFIPAGGVPPGRSDDLSRALTSAEVGALKGIQHAARRREQPSGADALRRTRRIIRWLKIIYFGFAGWQNGVCRCDLMAVVPDIAALVAV